eukprot:Tbor_TRINITY_DN3949_c0_g1::TRINITY_DN3949_c0_g1_i1::g.758::m.758
MGCAESSPTKDETNNDNVPNNDAKTSLKTVRISSYHREIQPLSTHVDGNKKKKNDQSIVLCNQRDRTRKLSVNNELAYNYNSSGSSSPKMPQKITYSQTSDNTIQSGISRQEISHPSVCQLSGQHLPAMLISPPLELSDDELDIVTGIESEMIDSRDDNIQNMENNALNINMNSHYKHSQKCEAFPNVGLEQHYPATYHQIHQTPQQYQKSIEEEMYNKQIPSPIPFVRLLSPSTRIVSNDPNTASLRSSVSPKIEQSEQYYRSHTSPTDVFSRDLSYSNHLYKNKEHNEQNDPHGALYDRGINNYYGGSMEVHGLSQSPSKSYDEMEGNGGISYSNDHGFMRAHSYNPILSLLADYTALYRNQYSNPRSTTPFRSSLPPLIDKVNEVTRPIESDYDGKSEKNMTTQSTRDGGKVITMISGMTGKRVKLVKKSRLVRRSHSTKSSICDGPGIGCRAKYNDISTIFNKTQEKGHKEQKPYLSKESQRCNEAISLALKKRKDKLAMIQHEREMVLAYRRNKKNMVDMQ